MSSEPHVPRAKFCVLEGPNKGAEVLLVDPPPRPLEGDCIATIGRGEENDLQLKDRSVSREHVRIEYDGHYFWIVDCGSSNGTLVNDERIGRYMLYDGDVVCMGHVRIQFRAIPAPAGP